MTHFLSQDFVFIGRSGSLGYRRGVTYPLSLQIDLDSPTQVVILKPTKCPYTTLDAFCRNWKLPEEAARFLVEYYERREKMKLLDDEHDAPKKPVDL